nr:hypothetical protein BaRGS_028563 [Batillaria attramentaria]
MKQKQKQGLVNEKEEQEFQRHTELKMRAKAEKTQDKELAKKDPTKHVILDFKYLASQIIRNTKVDKNNKRVTRRRQPDLAQIIRPRYTEKLPVSEAKKRDLVSLCRSGVIPEDHHPFYENLPTASSKVDRLEEPDVEDVDSGEETD